MAVPDSRKTRRMCGGFGAGMCGRQDRLGRTNPGTRCSRAIRPGPRYTGTRAARRRAFSHLVQQFDWECQYLPPTPRKSRCSNSMLSFTFKMCAMDGNGIGVASLVFFLFRVLV